jgi:aspartate racemase
VEKVIGVLGGMGPEATLSFYAKLLASTPAARDQDHLRVIIDSNPKVPDRTAALLGQGESPVPAMAAGLEALARAGADLAVIPCVSAHAFLAELRARSPIPVLSILDVAAEAVRGRVPPVRTAGLLATTGTVRSGVFQTALAAAGVGVRVPTPAEQERVMAAIYSIKGALGNMERKALRDALGVIARRLVADGAEAIVLGCTELPLILADADLGVPVFDVVLLLARAAIVAAGREPAA